MDAEDWLALLIIFAVICWIVLIYFWPYATLLPFLIGGIVELFWPYSERHNCTHNS